MNKIATFIEKFIIYALIGMMVIILILATIELGYYLVKNILNSNYLLIDLDNLMDLFGVFLLVLIGIELLDTIKVYLRRNVVHVEVVVLVAIIAIARKVVVLKIEQLSGELIMGIGVLVISLSVHFIILATSFFESNLLSLFFLNKFQSILSSLFNHFFIFSS